MTAYRILDVDGVTATAEALSTRVSVAVPAFLPAFATQSLLA
jgi:hypothetical protein